MIMEASTKKEKNPINSPKSLKKLTLAAEDMAIIKFVAKKSKNLDISSNKLWKEMKAKISSEHSWKTMKTRYWNHILPNLANYPISASWNNLLAKHLKTGQQNLPNISLESAVKTYGLRKFTTAPVTFLAVQQINDRKSNPVDTKMKKSQSSSRLKKIVNEKSLDGDGHSDESLTCAKNIPSTSSKLQKSSKFNNPESLNIDLETEYLHRDLKMKDLPLGKRLRPKLLIKKQLIDPLDNLEKPLNNDEVNEILLSSSLKQDVTRQSIGEELTNSGACSSICLNESLTNTELFQLDESVNMNPREILMTTLGSSGRNKCNSLLKEFEKDSKFMEMVDMVKVLMNKYDLPYQHVLKILYMNNGIYEDAEHWIKFRTNKEGKLAWDEIDDMMLITGNEQEMNRLLLIHGQDRIDERIRYLDIKRFNKVS